MMLADGSWARRLDQPIRVLVVHDHNHVLWGLTKLIEGEWPRMEVAAAARSVGELITTLKTKRVDIVILDLCVAGKATLPVLPSIQEVGAAAVVLTGSRSEFVHRRALDSGARSVVLKEEPADVLLHEIERVHGLQMSPRGDGAREQDCHLAVKARIAGFLLSTTRR